MILAAGLGTRMRPLTDKLPKPLIPVRGKPLIDYHLARCQAAGVKQVVVNVSYLGHMIEEHLAQGTWDLEILFSREPEPLDVVGGLRQALPLLGDQPFWCLSADVFTDLSLSAVQPQLSEDCYGHFLLVPNPAHHPDGDFGLSANSGKSPAYLTNTPPCYTYSGMAFLSARLLIECAADPAQKRLAPMVRQAIVQQKVRGEVYHGLWSDVGTPERRADLEKLLGP